MKKVSLKGFIIKSLVSIPHISLLIDRRVNYRYKPRDGIEINISGKGTKIYGHLLDISLGGMRIISTDERIEGLTRISLTVEGFKIELPCREIRKVGPYYGIIFQELEKHVAANMINFLDRFMKKPPVFLASAGR